MRVKKLNCINFRNISDLTVLPCDGMNVICGENAQGKTNIIEAIWLFTGAKSFRNTKDSVFVKFGEKKAENSIEFLFGGIFNTARMEFDEKKTAVLNEKQLSNPSKLAGTFNAIIFSPSDLSLVKDGPVNRRKFLDLSIGQLYPNYIEILREYTRAVVQRNKIIKDYRFDGSLSVMLDVFEDSIASNGIKIYNYRQKYIEMLENYTPDIYKGLSSGREKMMSVYVAEYNDINLREKLYSSRKEDMYTATTSVGPHRDDVDFLLDGISARNYGSQGQKRSVAITLKLAGAEIIKKETGEYPVCLLDDVMSELDPIRQGYILNHIKGWQSFITCCDPSNTKNLNEGKIFTVRNGVVE